MTNYIPQKELLCHGLTACEVSHRSHNTWNVTHAHACKVPCVECLEFDDLTHRGNKGKMSHLTLS